MLQFVLSIFFVPLLPLLVDDLKKYEKKSLRAPQKISCTPQNQ